MKNIIFFITSGLKKPGGAERVLCLIANNLSKLGYNVSILSYNSENESFYYLSDDIKRISLGYSMSKNWFSNKIEFIKLFFKYRLIVKQNKSNIVIPLGTEAAIITSVALLFYSNIKKMVWIHYSFFQKLKLRDIFFRKIFIRSFDKIIVLNKTDKEKFSELFPGKVEYIPNPVSFTSIETSKLNNKVCIAAGRLNKIKGFDLLINAFYIVVNKYGHSDWKLKIFGNDDGEKTALNCLINKLNLANNVIINNAILSIKEEYLSSDTYLMTSLNECFPMVLLEVQEVGLPIISFDCNSGARDIVEDGVNGILVEPYNVLAFAEAISKLIKDENLMIEMGKQAKMNVKKFYIENIISKWQNIL